MAGAGVTERNFRALLEARWDAGLFVSVGLDPDWDRLPAGLRAAAGSDASDDAKAEAVRAFCIAIVDATADLACAFKPNAAFFERFGAAGIAALGAVTRHMRSRAPEVPVIYDAKRGDIGSTNAGYVEDAFDRLGADAITVHPYLGAESLRPFLDRADRGTIVLVRTSNPGGGEFQDLAVGGEPLYRVVARRVAEHWNGKKNCAVVVGATYPQELAAVRALVGDMPILIPGVGAQGGDVRLTVEAGRDARGRGMIINSSRGIIYASAGNDFAEAARAETLRLTRDIQSFNR
jgi:orotidine-5'-phosphate decarboxylase